MPTFLNWDSLPGVAAKFLKTVTPNTIDLVSPASTDLSDFTDMTVYTPTYTGVTNITSVADASSTSSYYFKLASFVVVVNKCDVDPVAAGATTFRISLPVASNFTGVNQAWGVGADGTEHGALRVQATAATDDLTCQFVAASTTSRTFAIVTIYRIL